MTHCHTFLSALRRRGFRVTPQREMIVEAIAHGGRHLTAEQIFLKVQRRTSALNIATVYRTLELLVEEGLVTRTNLGAGKEVFASIRHGPHVHLVCRSCGNVIEADGSLVLPLGEQIDDLYRFASDLQHLSIPGVCEACRPALEGGGER
jgi:Fur family ferric uptake transcriptional regulator